MILAVIGGVAAGYRFYWKDQVAKYREDEDRLAQLEKKSKQIANTFQGCVPKDVVRAYSGAVEPWREAVQERSEGLVGTLRQTVDPPPEGQVPRFWYEEEFAKRQLALQQYVYTKGLPPLVNDTFGAATLGELTSRDVGRRQAVEWLEQFELGSAVVHLLVEEGARYVDRIEIWPERITKTGDFRIQSYGLIFGMTLEDLVKFMNGLNRGNHFFYVEGLRIANPQLANPNPQLRIEMLLSEARFIPGEGPKPATLPAASLDMGLPGVKEAGEEDEEGAPRSYGPGRRAPLTRWQRFRRRFLPF
ncbi:MAG: hypothetical protein JXR94_22390 [Candidatus Hydrogenedentes bacterium]|nr:hypothetical protein [Candidatus Hydrogenedentota bacterium]